MARLLFLSILSAGLLMLSACSSVKENPIKVNQVGYYPQAEKIAVLEADAKSADVKLVDVEGNTVWEGKADHEATSAWSGKTRAIVDFSEVTTPGEYTLQAGKYSQPISIKENALAEVAQAGMKAYYLQRCGCPIEEQYAGIYARPTAHPDTFVMVHPSAATDARPAGTIISSPLGWYDAGDFNKYIVNSGFTIGMLLLGYEADPAYYNAWNLNIPESGNDMPDMLDEIMYNLRWMATMQDPNDGGVYHKLTTPNFEGFVMPTDCHQQRYVVQKSTTAALDFAATMAMVNRIYKNHPDYAEFAQQMLAQAEKAYAWAVKNPKVLYDQPGYNETCEPKVNTGMYPDTNTDDEFFWAATELYLATGQNIYLETARQFAPESFRLPVWGDIEALGTYEWIQESLNGNAVAQEMVQKLAPSLLTSMDERLGEVATSCYHMPYGNRETDFCWGGNAEICAGVGVGMLYAYRLTNDPKYLIGALEQANYLLGQNATGYCFVTGFGSKQVMHPHQRLSSADGIEAPLPGFLAGGPNPGQQDKEAGHLTYPSSHPDESYLDEEPSYASNEIAINWNAYLVALMGGIDAQLK